MIWDLLQQSTFDRHFSSPDLKIVTLLLDENIITELKNQNPQLLAQYPCRHAVSTPTSPPSCRSCSPTPPPCPTPPRATPAATTCPTSVPSCSPSTAPSSSRSSSGRGWRTPTTTGGGSWCGSCRRRPPRTRCSWGISRRCSPICRTRAQPGYAWGEVGDGGGAEVPGGVHGEGGQWVGGRSHEEGGGAGGESGRGSAAGEGGHRGSAACGDGGGSCRAAGRGSRDTQRTNWQIPSRQFRRPPHRSCAVDPASRDHPRPLRTPPPTQNRQPIDSFLANLLKKHLQTTVNELDQTVSLLPLPQSLLALAQTYILREAKLLQQSTPNAYLRNQSGKTVRRLGRRVLPMLELIALGLESGLEIATAEIVGQLWGLVALFPFNDILQVAVLRVFSGVLGGKARGVLLEHYEAYLLGLAKVEERMFRPFIFGVWKLAKRHPTATTDQEVLEKFAQYVSGQLEPLLKYEIAPNAHGHHSQKKLVVDEEDAVTAGQENVASWRGNSAEKEEKQAVYEAKNEEKEGSPEVGEPQKPQPPKKQENPFDFFGGWQQPAPPKQDLFGDFTSFF